MRWKIIAVNVGVVVLIGLLTYLLMWTSLGGALSNPAERKREVARALGGANAQLALDALRLERWLTSRANSSAVQDVFARGTQSARQEGATAQANELYKAAIEEPSFTKIAPSLVLIVDKQGIALGRNGSNMMRGDDMAKAYPTLADTLKTGNTHSDLWLNRSRGEQMLASFAPVRGADGDIIGAVVVGTPLNDDRLARTAELTSGGTLLLGVPDASGVQIIAKSAGGGPGVAGASEPAVVEDAKAALASGNPSSGDVAQGGQLFGAAPLLGYGDGKRAVVIAAVPQSLVPNLSALLWPVLAVALLGIGIVSVAGWLLGNYWGRPIADIEEGLLMIMNGRTDMRFDMEHPELGGLVFRINSLLNALTGTPEDTTDEQGRPSRPPQASDFQQP
jgi:hypothetical protein